MKNIIAAFTILVVLLLSSCSKSTTSGNSWTFKGTTYKTATTTDAGGGYWDIASVNPTGTMQVNFSTSTLPTTSGTYTVVAHGSSLTGGNKLTIYLQTSDGYIFYSTGGTGSPQTVSVNVSNGKVSVSGSGIELVSNNTSTDLANVALNVTQL